MPKRKNRFAVGYQGPGQVAYGTDADDGKAQWIELMSKPEAKGRLAKMKVASWSPHLARMYELVEVEPRD